MSEETELLHKLNAKTQEIERLVAKAYGLGDYDNLNPTALQQLKDEVEEMIEAHDEAVTDGDTIEEWRALDQRLASTPVGRLLHERYEIEQQILDLRDADL
jgi:regulator of sigma D